MSTRCKLATFVFEPANARRASPQGHITGGIWSSWEMRWLGMGGEKACEFAGNETAPLLCRFRLTRKAWHGPSFLKCWARLTRDRRCARLGRAHAPMVFEMMQHTEQLSFAHLASDIMADGCAEDLSF